MRDETFSSLTAVTYSISDAGGATRSGNTIRTKCSVHVVVLGPVKRISAATKGLGLVPVLPQVRHEHVAHHVARGSIGLWPVARSVIPGTLPHACRAATRESDRSRVHAVRERLGSFPCPARRRNPQTDVRGSLWGGLGASVAPVWEPAFLCGRDVTGQALVAAVEATTEAVTAAWTSVMV